MPSKRGKKQKRKDAWYGKISSSMDTLASQNSPAPPRVFKTLVAGFDVIANHIELLIFSICIDLILWLAPHLSLKPIIENWLAITFQMILDEPDMAEMGEAAREIWLVIAEQFNLLVTLRSYPVGIPSLMASGLPSVVPYGIPEWIQLNSGGMAILIYLLLSMIGLVMGTLFYIIVSDITLNAGIQWGRVFSTWPRASVQVFLLALMWIALILGISVPAICGLSIAVLFGISPDLLLIFILGTLVMWLAFPLLFSAHGIFVLQHNAWISVKKSVRITKMTLPTTMTFVMLIVLVSQGLDILWRVAPEDSWLMLIGIAGHSFIAAGLLASSFIYYRESNLWVEHIQELFAEKELKTKKAA